MTSEPVTARRDAEGQPGITAFKSLAMVVAITGMLITAAGTTIVVLALPEIERGLYVALSTVIWVVIGHLLVITLLATRVGAVAAAPCVIDVNGTVAWRPLIG
ncbi:MAG: hypothetical protein ACLQCU_06620 [Acidimicrobiales bacterium]|jgi:hypothetical protein